MLNPTLQGEKILPTQRTTKPQYLLLEGNEGRKQYCALSKRTVDHIKGVLYPITTASKLKSLTSIVVNDRDMQCNSNCMIAKLLGPFTIILAPH